MDTQQKALAMLVSGLTDASVGHRLGVSERTIQRYVKALKEAAGCHNRMQLGRHAALSGLPAYGPEPAPAPDGIPDAATRRLLELLLADRSEAVPGVLFLSRRSVERRVREIMLAVGAQSRVQLGWRVTRWGWV